MIDDLVQEMPMPADCAVELRVADRPGPLSLLVTSTNLLDIDCNRCSVMQRLLRVTAHVLRFVGNLKKSIKSGSHTMKEDAPTSEAELLTRAEVQWIKVAQKQLAQDGSFEKLKKQFGLF